MRVKIGDKIYDTYEEPIMLVFENAAEVSQTIVNLAVMPTKEGIRKYLIHPNSEYTKEEAENFMKI